MFGKEFCSQLKTQVESDKTLTQVVQLSHRYKPYDQRARQSTLGRSKKQFFRQPCWEYGVPAGQCSPPHQTELLPQQAAIQATAPVTVQLPSPHSLGEIGKILSDLPLPHPSLLALNLKMDLLAQHISTPASGRQNLPVFRELDKGNKGPLGAYYNQGISNTSEILAKRTLVNYHSQRRTTICTTGGSNQAEGEGGSSPSAADGSSYRQPSLCGSKARRRLEADNRPEISQFMHGTAALQDGGTVYAPQHGEPGMAYGKIRPKRRILNHPYSPRISEAPYFSGWASTSTDAVPLSSILALHRTIRLFKGYKANNSISTAVRNPSDSLSRRPTAGSSIQKAIIGESFDSNMASQQSGVPNKYPEVHHNSNLSPRVLRICSGYRSDDNISPNTQDQCHYERCNPPSSVRIVASERFGMSHWDISSNQASGMNWTPTLSCPARLENTNTSAARFLSDIDKPVTRGESRSPVVALRLESQLLSSDCETRSLDSHGVRRLHVRLGSSLPGSYNWWQMDIRGGWFPHQLVGAPSNFSGFAVLFEGQDQRVSFDQIGQSHCYSLPEQDGQPHTIPALPTSSEDLAMVPYTSDFSSCRILGGEGQRFGRLGIPSSRQQRLATPAIGFRCNPPPPGSLYNRSLCKQNEHPTANLLQLETGPAGKGGGCLFNIMVTRPALSFPSLLPNWEGTHEDSARRGRLCLSDSSGMASSSVVSSGAEDVSEEPSPPSEGAGSPVSSGLESSPFDSRESVVSNRMACLRQDFSSQGFSKRVTELLLQSWRTNTHAAYNSAWSKWCRWCFGRNTDPLSASLGSILEFLADQFDLGLQYRSLNTLRSAISTSHAQIDSVNVGSHPVVSRLLRGMFNARPPAPHYSESWNVAMVVQYLRNCPSEGLPIAELGKKVVTLMALANASRRSDLAALDRDYLRWTPSGAQFTVVQLTKTRTPGPPKLVHYSFLSEDPEVCLATTLRIYLTKTSDRVAIVNSPKPIFLTSRKPFRRECPGTLGHWIKECLGKAGVDTERFTATLPGVLVPHKPEQEESP